MISRRENLMRVFRHEKPEWIPMCGHCDPYNQPKRDGMDPDLAVKLANVRWADESTALLSRYLDLDIADWYRPPFFVVPGPSIRREQKKDGADTITLWHTPNGALREVRRQPPDGQGYIVEHFVKTPDDLPLLADYYESLTIKFSQDLVSEAQQRRALIGDDGIVMCPMPGTPLSEMIRRYAGVETTAYLTADAPDALRALFEIMTRRHLESHALAAAQPGIDAVVGVDDTSTTTQSPAMFETYCLDYTNRMADAVHAHGKWYIHHSCGLIKDLVGLYRQTRMDAVHALCPPPIGNITVRDARRAMGDRIVIFASLSQLFGALDWAAIEQSVREMFEGAAPGDNFLVGLAPDPNVTIADTQRFIALVRPYQRMYAAPSAG